MRLILILTALLSFQSASASEFDEINDEIKARAYEGDASAQFALGVMYHHGDGVPEDYAEAVKWYRKAAEQGDASAQSLLGFMYANGKGVPEDDTEAVKWYRKAAEQGAADAQFNLGLMYLSGEGVPEDHIRAYIWTSMAKTQGNKSAAVANDLVRAIMTSQQLAQGQALATRCYESSYKDCE